MKMTMHKKLSLTFIGSDKDKNCKGEHIRKYLSDHYTCNTYVLFLLDTKGYERSFLHGAAIIVIVFVVIRLLIETIQILRKRFHYFLDWENWMELCMFIATIIFVSSGLQSGCLCPESWQWQFGALALFVAWFDMILFLKKFPLTGIYVVMFVDIFYSFMRMILLYILFIVSFGLAFYMILFQPVRVYTMNISYDYETKFAICSCKLATCMSIVRYS